MKLVTNIFFLLILISLRISLFSQEDKTKFEKLNATLQNEYGSKFSFSVIVADNDKILFSNSFGYADSLKTIKTSPNTLYHIASITKSFTALGIFLLIEEKKVNLNDTLGKFFKNVPNDKRSITIANLLSHKSGFEQNYVNYGIENSDKALSALFNDTLSSVPGTNFKYSNENIEMLALIIEKVTGFKYEDYIRQRILIPLEMQNTFFWDEVKRSKNVAWIKEQIADTLLNRNWDYIGSGGIYSNPADLYKFIKGVIENRIISSQTTELMFTEQFRTSSGLSISFGWFENDKTDWGSRLIWTRGSESWGHNAVIWWLPDIEKILIVCTNSGEMGEKNVTGNRIVSKFIADYLWK